MKNTVYLYCLFCLLFVWLTNCLCIATPGTGLSSEGEMEVPVPPNDHPRLLIQINDLPALIEKVDKANMRQLWVYVLINIQKNVDGKLPSRKYNANHNHDPDLLEIIESHALYYLIEKNTNTGRKAIQMMQNYMNTLDFSPREEAMYNKSIYSGETLYAGAKVYDWCYDLLSENEKQVFITQFEKLASQQEIGYPPDIKSAVSGHSTGPLVLRNLLSAGIAIYNEKEDMYHYAADPIIADFVDARNFLYASHMNYQGDSYGPGKFELDMIANLIFAKMGYPDVMSKDLGKVPYRSMYNRRPDGTLMREGDSYLNNRDWKSNSTYWMNNPHIYLYTAAYYNDPYIQDEVLRELSEMNINEVILLYNPDLNNFSQSELPLSKYFPSPIGSMVARTSWNNWDAYGKPYLNSRAVIAEMRVNEYHFNNHQHLNDGAFQIYYKGGLAIDAGVYEGTVSGYGGLHDRNYHKRSIAHNTMLIYDPDQIMYGMRGQVDNDGGMYWPNTGSEPKTIEQVLTGDFHTSTVLAHDFGPDSITPEYTYLKGDHTNAYMDRAEEFQRSFLFLNLNDNQHPAAFIVYDYVKSTNKDFKKYWLLHSVEEPVVQGNKTTIVRSQRGYNGKLVNEALLPAPDDLEIEKIGGNGKEFWVFGTNYPNYPKRSNTSSESGNWRIQISPRNPANENQFLNVMQVMDYNGGPDPLPVQKFESEDFVGAYIDDYVAFFSKNGKKLSYEFNFEVEGSGMHKLVITDLSAGNWTVEKGGNPVAEYQVSETSGVLYFQGDAGSYTLKYDEATSSYPIEMKEIKEINEIEVYPNPATNFLHVSGIESESNITVLNMLGQHVLNCIVNRASINIKGLKDGVYFLKVKNKSQVNVIRFLKKSEN